MILKKAIIITSLLLPLGAILTAGVALALPQKGEEEKSVLFPKASAVQEVAIDASFFPKTYYVGDLVGVEKVRKDGPEVLKVNMDPLVDLIQSTIAPGSWRVRDTEGHEIFIGDPVTRSYKQAPGDPDQRIGLLTPFYLSNSLIIRHTAEVHDQVAKLLRFLRDFRYKTRFADSVGRPVAPAPASVPSQAPRVPVISQADRKQRLKQLLDELRQAIDTMDREGEPPQALELIR